MQYLLLICADESLEVAPESAAGAKLVEPCCLRGQVMLLGTARRAAGGDVEQVAADGVEATSPRPAVSAGHGASSS